MKLRRSLPILVLPLAMMAVVVALFSIAQVSWAEQTVTVYKNPT